MATQPITSEVARETVATLPPSEPAATVAPASATANGANGHAAPSNTATVSKPEPKSQVKSSAEESKEESKPESASLEPGRFDWLVATSRKLWRGVPSWFTSLFLHALAFLVLGLSFFDPPKNPHEMAIAAKPESNNESLEDLNSSLISESDGSLTTFDSTLSAVNSGPLVGEPLTPINPLATGNDSDDDPADGRLPLGALNDSLMPQQDLLKPIGVPGGTGEGLGGRTGTVKGELLRKGGGSDASEAAVARGLRWLSKHQMPDGGWNFDLEKCPGCKGLCKDSGEYSQARMGATAMALLPFLGAGQTHREGQYKEVVRKGLYYITTHTQNTGGFLNMHEDKGTMYSHGLGTIALCEAYAMTNDRTLIPYAQGAVNYIVYAQDPVGGGWRYQPREDGDTSVVGWQIMALKSAQMAGLEVPTSVFTRATKFLDSVQSDNGSTYGYTAPSAGFPRTTSSVGLLCRMYLGWKRDNAALKRGVALISREGPSMPARVNNTADMYYNYYATQVLRHWGGSDFDQWNGKVRDWLIETQAREAHEAGSWYFNFAQHSRVGGRLYCTSMATMILEVYYRHLPLYGGKAVDDEFTRKD